MSVTTYTARSCPKLSISQVSSMTSAPSSPIGVEATITISTKKPNKMSSGSVESTAESSDPLESDYSEDDGQDFANDLSSEEDQEEYESSQKNNLSESESEDGNGDDTDEDSNIDDAVKGGRKFSLDDFQILKTVGKFFFNIALYK